MKKRWLIAAVLLGGLVGIVKQAPLAWIVGDRLVIADPEAMAMGTVWAGHIAYIEGLPPISTELNRTQVTLTANGGQLEMSGVASPQGLSDLSLILAINSLKRFDPRLAGLQGEISLNIDEMLFSEARCLTATGQASTDVLAVNNARWQWVGPRLNGPIQCQDGGVIIDLAGQNATASVAAQIAIDPSGPYRTTVIVDTTDPGAALVLPLFGFERTGQSAFRLSESGAWQ